MGGLALQTIEALVPYIQDIRDPTNKIMSQWEKEISPTTGTARDLRLHQLHFAGAISPEEEVCCHYLGAKSSKSSVQTILDVHIVDNICIVLNFWKQASVQRRFSTRKTGGSTCRAVAALAPKWLPAQGGYRDVTLLEEQ
ncbi:uncharacterized protein [Aegilops tauschii subsp. strangulata]|uniref:Uncharacterized protein n=2 Tax=Triticinae TaxID=1648030 RepID=A0A453RIU3_AEGTS